MRQESYRFLTQSLKNINPWLFSYRIISGLIFQGLHKSGPRIQFSDSPHLFVPTPNPQLHQPLCTLNIQAATCWQRKFGQSGNALHLPVTSTSCPSLDPLPPWSLFWSLQPTTNSLPEISSSELVYCYPGTNHLGVCTVQLLGEKGPFSVILKIPHKVYQYVLHNITYIC